MTEKKESFTTKEKISVGIYGLVVMIAVIGLLLRGNTNYDEPSIKILLALIFILTPICIYIILDGLISLRKEKQRDSE